MGGTTVEKRVNGFTRAEVEGAIKTLTELRGDASTPANREAALKVTPIIDAFLVGFDGVRRGLLGGNLLWVSERSDSDEPGIEDAAIGGCGYIFISDFSRKEMFTTLYSEYFPLRMKTIEMSDDEYSEWKGSEEDRYAGWLATSLSIFMGVAPNVPTVSGPRCPGAIVMLDGYAVIRGIMDPMLGDVVQVITLDEVFAD